MGLTDRAGGRGRQGPQEGRTVQEGGEQETEGAEALEEWQKGGRRLQAVLDALISLAQLPDTGEDPPTAGRRNKFRGEKQAPNLHN